MKEKSVQYFTNTIMPMIHEKHSDILQEASIMVLGSVGLGIDDELSDMEAVVYLPDEIWKKNGMFQINLDKCLRDKNIWKQDGSIICVHPLSWLLDGNGEKILAESNVNWEKLSFDSQYGLFVLQNQFIWYDPQERLSRLRKLTTPNKMPELLWKKALLEKINCFVTDGIQETRRCIERNHYLDAYIPYADAVKALLEIGFIICRQYYPYRKHLSWAFGKLPAPITELDISVNKLSIAVNWKDRLSIMESIYCFYRQYILSNALLPELDFIRIDLREMPLHDNEFNIAENVLNNPNWRTEQKIIMEKTLKLGLEPEAARWVSWWGMI
jgi:hypothetical protein